MGLFRRKPRTRAELIAAADRARVRGQLQAAASGYREVLKEDPTDPAVHVKLAPVLARLGDGEGAARSYRAAAQRHLAAGFTDRAAAVNAAAVGVLPLDAGFRLELARLELLRGRKRDAVITLVAGGRALLRARRLEAAVSLLRRALEAEPQHLEASLALGPALAARGEREEARTLLERLLASTRGRDRRRVRWALLRVSPSPGAFWRWLTG
jgi:Flp pilus assembly protein TadD